MELPTLNLDYYLLNIRALLTAEELEKITPFPTKIHPYAFTKLADSYKVKFNTNQVINHNLVIDKEPGFLFTLHQTQGKKDIILDVGIKLLAIHPFSEYKSQLALIDAQDLEGIVTLQHRIKKHDPIQLQLLEAYLPADTDNYKNLQNLK